jgi:hypothetical protein
MNKIILLFCLAVSSLYACRNRNPNLSEKQLEVLMNDSIQRAKEILSDTSYVPPTGARYTEIQSDDDPAMAPAIIDIVGNLGNIKELKISDFASSVRYIILQPPPETKLTSIANVVSDDAHIFINALEG